MKTLFTFITFAVVGPWLLAQESEIVSGVNAASFTRVHIQATPALHYTGFSSVLQSGVEQSKKANSINKAFADSNRVSRITKYSIDHNEKMRIWMSIAEDQTTMEIAVFNLLGKKIKDLDKLTLDASTEKQVGEYDLREIPYNGVYIVAVQGNNFRDAIKISISR